MYIFRLEKRFRREVDIFTDEEQSIETNIILLSILYIIKLTKIKNKRTIS